MLSGFFGILIRSQDLPWDFTGFLGSQWDLMDIPWDFKWRFRDSLGFLRISRIFITWWDSFLIKTTPTPPPSYPPPLPPTGTSSIPQLWRKDQEEEEESILKSINAAECLVRGGGIVGKETLRMPSASVTPSQQLTALPWQPRAFITQLLGCCLPVLCYHQVNTN